MFDIGDVLNEIDYEQRWIYKGAMPEPPCLQYVYWNVINRVFPIEIDRFAIYKDYMYSKKKYLGSYKNNRKIQPVHVEKYAHGIAYISATYFSKIRVCVITAAMAVLYSYI